MKPFKFFFALSLGVFFLFFIAKFVIMAAIVAAVLSFLFFVGRKIKNFFRYLTWEDPYYPNSDYRFEGYSDRTPQMRMWKQEFFSDFSRRREAYPPNLKVIKIY